MEEPCRVDVLCDTGPVSACVCPNSHSWAFYSKRFSISFSKPVLFSLVFHVIHVDRYIFSCLCLNVDNADLSCGPTKARDRCMPEPRQRPEP